MILEIASQYPEDNILSPEGEEDEGGDPVEGDVMYDSSNDASS
jgi:hypothetical protein